VSPLLVALLGVLLIPLFLASWRASLAGLGAQGVLMALIAWRLGHGAHTAGEWLTLLDLGLVRGLAVPVALYTVMRAANAPARHDIIPANMLSWTVALGMGLVAFTFAEQLVADAGDPRTLVAVSAAGVLLGFLVLATQSTPFGQMVGALRLENAIALLELGGARREEPLGLKLAVFVVFVATAAFFRGYLVRLQAPPAKASAGEPSEGPTL
jgi:hydrogenase-4 membrane subunit HyfE